MNKVLLAIVVLSIVLCSPAYSGDGSIGYLFDGKPVIKVFIGQVSNESGDAAIATDVFKKSLEESLKNRKAMYFTIVKTAAESDIQISAVIEKYQYLDRGPFNPSPGIAMTVIDAAATMTHNYAEMTTDFTVTETKSGDTLWSEPLNVYVKRVMTAGESIALIYDKITRRFIWKCFGSPHEKGMVAEPR